MIGVLELSVWILVRDDVHEIIQTTVSHQLGNANGFFSNNLICVETEDDIMFQTLFVFYVDDQVLDKLLTWIWTL
jgi:hypothetical protein